MKVLNSTPPRKAILLCLLLVVLLLTSSAYAVTLTGPAKACPGSTREYMISTNLAVTKVSIWQGQYPSGNCTLLAEQYVTSGVPFDVNFPAAYQGIVTVFVTSWFLFEGNPYGSENASMYVNVSLPKPASPSNFGQAIIGCQANERINLSSLPALVNGPDDCYFHCGIEWAAPGGWNLENNDASGNPLNQYTTFSNTRLVVPSGVSNGIAGVVAVTAYYNQCGFTINTSNSSSIWYGTPLIESAEANGAPVSGPINTIGGNALLRVTSTAGSATSWEWEINSGDGQIIWSDENQCSVSTSSYVRVVVRSVNRCGQGTSYSFDIINDGEVSPYRVSPNPTGNTMTVQFDYPEMTELIESVNLYDEKGKISRSFNGVKAKGGNYFERTKAVEWDVRDLPRGNYFLHVNYGSTVSKSQVLLN